MSSDGGALLSKCPALALRLHRRYLDRVVDGRDPWWGHIIQRRLPDLACGVLVQVLEYVQVSMPYGMLPGREFEYFYIHG